MFLENFYTAFTQVAILTVLMAIGFCTHKGGLFTEETAKKCNGLLFYFVTPCVIAHSFMGLSKDTETLTLLGVTLVAVILFHLFGAILVRLFFGKSKSPAVYRFASMYGNLGYMGIPLAKAVVGETGVFICSIAVFVFNFFCFTHGGAMMDKAGGGKIKLFKMLVNPGTIGIAIGIPLMLIPFEIPSIISEPITHLAALNTPLAMLLLGTYLGATNLSSIFKIPENYLTVSIKLILLPAITLAIASLCGLQGDLLITLTLLAAMPSASNTVMFAAEYKRNTGRASMAVACTNIVSIITIPVWIALAQSL